MEEVFLSPSLYSHIINGLLLFVAFIIIYTNYSRIMSLGPYKQVIITLLLSICIGVHGLSHLGLEKGYGYNPLNLIISR